MKTDLTLTLSGLCLIVFLAFECHQDTATSNEPQPTVETVAAPLTALESKDSTWRQDSIWDDGKAEYASYAYTCQRYGHEWQGTALLVTVKEPWAPELHVKADRPREKGFEVIKLNHIRDVQTGIYTYHQAFSAFVRRDNGALEKFVATSSEACGISTAHMTEGKLSLRSYFDRQGDRELEWDARALPVDGLALQLRDYLSGKHPQTITLYPELMRGRFKADKTRSYNLTREQHEKFTVPAGTFAAISLTLKSSSQTLRFVFNANSPHTLLAMQPSADAAYKLQKVERIAYWNRHSPGDESWHPKTTPTKDK